VQRDPKLVREGIDWFTRYFRCSKNAGTVKLAICPAASNRC